MPRWAAWRRRIHLHRRRRRRSTLPLRPPWCRSRCRPRRRPLKRPGGCRNPGHCNHRRWPQSSPGRCRPLPGTACRRTRRHPSRRTRWLHLWRRRRCLHHSRCRRRHRLPCRFRGWWRCCRRSPRRLQIHRRPHPRTPRIRRSCSRWGRCSRLPVRPDGSWGLHRHSRRCGARTRQVRCRPCRRLQWCPSRPRRCRQTRWRRPLRRLHPLCRHSRCLPHRRPPLHPDGSRRPGRCSRPRCP